ncbi:MAG: ATPase [Nitrospirae bacterium RBG_19FT_COMBO_42_15]|nr:MAG: ATPase [Nitrospirae bacterium RBG_19FT_COMBO_42_15]
MVEAIHINVKGRARYRIKGLHRSEYLKRHIESRLSDGKGISYASASAMTGNVLVIFNSNNSYEGIALLIQGIVSEYKKSAGTDAINKPYSSAAKVINRHSESQKGKPWHFIDTEAVLNFFGVSRGQGLSGDSVAKHLEQYGLNILPEAVPRSGFTIFINQFKSLPVALLGAAAGISIFTGGIADALIITGVVVINAAIGYTTESQAEKTIHSLKKLVRPSALVIRDGKAKEIRADDLVPGDIMILRPGSYVAADARLIEANYLSVDESTLTGESMPVVKKVQSLELGVMSGENSAIHNPQSAISEIPLADRINMVYMGTLVTGGQGIAVVAATGAFTEIGRIQTMVGEARPPETPMERQLDKMGSQLVLIGGAVCVGVFAIGLLKGYGFLQMLKTSISLAVAAVPEGLPTIATTTLALGIRDMRRHNILIRHLDAVETLGSVQTICLDKTGTITMNRMSVSAVYTGMKRIKVSDGEFIFDDPKIKGIAKGEFMRLLEITVLCNESEAAKIEDEYIVSGSSTENALIYMAVNSGIDVVELRKKFQLLKIQHRSENRNYMITIHKEEKKKGRLIAIKGSPADVLSMCRQQIVNGKKTPIKDGDRLAIEIENERMAGNALRVLGVAYASIKQGQGTGGKGHEENMDGLDPQDFVWLGLVGMADPVRKGVKELIGDFHNAGIDTVMITGDQSPTAYAIGRELNLSKSEQLEILDSTHITNIDPDVMMALCNKVDVFARVSPANKLQIVQALQKNGKVVAMTGDGINDGPALKAADIGIAMGHTGTDVAREVADVVLEDDNLETMIIAISRGRTIYSNIRKSVHFLISTNLSEIMVMFSAIAGGLGQPLSAMQLLWINLISDIAPGLALALEPPEPDVLNQPPRNPDEPIIKTSDFKRIAFESAVLSAGALSAYGYGIMRYGIGQRTGTLAFMSLSIGQLLHAISCRSEKHSIFEREKMPSNRYLNIAIGGSLGLQLLTMIIPGLRNLLGITPISVSDGIVIGGSALLPLLVNEGTKQKINV